MASACSPRASRTCIVKCIATEDSIATCQLLARPTPGCPPVPPYPTRAEMQGQQIHSQKTLCCMRAGRCRAQGQLTWQGLCQCRSAPSSPSCRQRTSRWWSAPHAADVSAHNQGVFLQNLQTASGHESLLLAGCMLCGGTNAAGTGTAGQSRCSPEGASASVPRCHC